MRGRDRIIATVAATLVVLVAVWLLLVAPEREKASQAATAVTAAQAQLATAESAVSTARAAQAQYSTAYASLVSLGKAVPPSQEVPSLIYRLAQASGEKNVEFASITTTGSTGSGSSVTAPSATSAAASAGFTQMPFTFVFNGSYFDLEHLFRQIDGFTVQKSHGIAVSGRLLTIQSVKLAPYADAEAKGPTERLAGTITATAYVLPAGQGVTGPATPSSPTGTATPASSTTSTSSSPTPAAVARVTP